MEVVCSSLMLFYFTLGYGNKNASRATALSGLRLPCKLLPIPLSLADFQFQYLKDCEIFSHFTQFPFFVAGASVNMITLG